jgi:predicted metalloprotease
MQWTPGGTSSDIEDRRSSGGGFGGFGGRHLGIGGLIVLGLLSLIFRQNFFSLLSDSTPVSSQGSADRDAGEQREVQFVSFVLDDVQDTWTRLLAQSPNPYHRAKLVLFRDATQSGCGFAQAATGPFYCPSDEKAYVDLGFFDELSERFGAPGEFAQAYVLAHEIGHHVQDVMGTDREMRAAQQRNPGAANQLSVRLELQADCYAGVWGHSTKERKIVDNADIAEGLRAAAAVGDDRLQRMGRGRVSPETFTHGSSAQRMEWFRRGLESGQPSACDTFGR